MVPELESQLILRFMRITGMGPGDFVDGWKFFLGELEKGKTTCYFSDMPGFPTEEQYKERLTGNVL